jgi:hypothetical protein
MRKNEKQIADGVFRLTLAPMHGSVIAGDACKTVLTKVELDLKSRS